ncbi:MAG: hypothetical protein SCM96_05745 [Acidobacteriota bacterium]|nr:hypothetical protein [Acidobacteriota bacterium]
MKHKIRIIERKGIHHHFFHLSDQRFIEIPGCNHPAADKNLAERPVGRKIPVERLLFFPSDHAQPEQDVSQSLLRQIGFHMNQAALLKKELLGDLARFENQKPGFPVEINIPEPNGDMIHINPVRISFDLPFYIPSRRFFQGPELFFSAGLKMAGRL